MRKSLCLVVFLSGVAGFSLTAHAQNNNNNKKAVAAPPAAAAQQPKFKVDQNGRLILDKDGKPIPDIKYKVDKNGNPVLDQNGKPIPETTTANTPPGIMPLADCAEAKSAGGLVANLFANAVGGPLGQVINNAPCQH